MRSPGTLLALLLAVTAAPLAAQEYGPQPDAATRVPVARCTAAMPPAWS